MIPQRHKRRPRMHNVAKRLGALAVRFSVDWAAAQRANSKKSRGWDC